MLAILNRRADAKLGLWSARDGRIIHKPLVMRPFWNDKGAGHSQVKLTSVRNIRFRAAHGRYRYILVSSIDQDLESLRSALKIAGSDIINAEKAYFHSPAAAV